MSTNGRPVPIGGSCRGSPTRTRRLSPSFFFLFLTIVKLRSFFFLCPGGPAGSFLGDHYFWAGAFFFPGGPLFSPPALWGGGPPERAPPRGPRHSKDAGCLRP